MDLLTLGGDLHQMGDDLHQNIDFSLMSNHDINQYMIDTIFEITDVIQPPLTGMQLSSVFQHYFTLDDAIGLMSQSGVISSAQLPVTDNSSDDVESPSMPALDEGLSSSASIDQFLSRPVRIYTKSWLLNLEEQFHPWELYFNNSAISRKMANYFLVKGNLELTFYVDGTPFHSGCTLASYRYGATDHGSTLINGNWVSRSQRQHLYLNAATNKGGCICVPFLYPTPWIKTANPSPTPRQMGAINLDTIVELRQQGAVNDSVNISVFARLVDFELTAPTTDLVSMSGTSDEYTDGGPVSKVASAVADAAGMLSAIPSIAPFALATQMASSAVAGIARLFGYSRPIVLKDTDRVQNQVISSLALTDSCDTSKKLSATSKQELSIDPRIVGLPPDDQLSIKSFAQRETAFFKFDWRVDQNADDIISTVTVDPMCERQDNVSADDYDVWRIIPTSLSFITRNFNYWSGTIKLRYQCFGSQYQRGKIAFVYEPSQTFDPSSDWYTTNYYVIMDIAATRDVTLEIPWQQDDPYRSILPLRNGFQYGLGPIDGTSESNGSVYAVVVNDLVSPDGTSSVSFITSISAGDDFTLMDPTSINNRMSPYDPADRLVSQSSGPVFVTTEEENSPEQEGSPVKLANITSSVEDKTLMYFGERLTSARQLMKRYHYYTSARSATVSGYSESAHIIWSYPISPGYSPAGIHFPLNGFKYNYVGYSPFTYFRNAFYGWKGSIRYKATSKWGVIDNIIAIREQDTKSLADNDPFQRIDTVYPPNAGPSKTAELGRASKDLGSAGMALTVNRTVDALEFEVPYALPVRFSTTTIEADRIDLNSQADSYPSGNRFRLITTTKDDTNATYDLFVAAGEDFSFYGFNAAPQSFYYVNHPPSS